MVVSYLWVVNSFRTQTSIFAVKQWSYCLYPSWQRVQEKGSKKIPGYNICHSWEASALLTKRCFSDLGKEHVFKRLFFFVHTSQAVSKSLSNFLIWEMLCASLKVHKMEDPILPCSSGWSLSLVSLLSQAPLPPKGSPVCHQNVPHPGDHGV